jgi:peptide/nickel transport system substrate-binding protein
MKVTRYAKAAVAITAAVGLVVGVIAPANASTRTTLVLVESNALTSLNPATPDTNLTINTDIAYVTGMGFNYYDNHSSLQRNTILGTYKIVKNTAKDLRVMYTINKGKLWSDGTPITGVDLLLSHVVASGAYSKKAGLGDPTNSKTVPAFNSGNYGGVYDSHVVGLPVLSKDQMSVTIRYDSFQPDWQISGPGPSPVHALEELAAGKTKLGTAKENLAAKAKFLKDFTTYNSSAMKKMGKVWSISYNIKTVDPDTNPLLLVSNGAYLLRSAVADQSATLGLNPLYNSGPKTSGIKTIVFKMIADGTAAAQALANKEVDIYQGQPTADAVAQLKAIKGAGVIGGTSSCFEHVDLRVGSGESTSTYTGPFASSTDATKNQAALDLRTAFLLAYPRQQIVDTLIKPINSNAVVVNSAFTLPGQVGYSEIAAGSGVSKFTAGTQAERTATALALVKKQFPDASATNAPVKIKLLWGQPSNTRRASEAALVKAAEAAAGFDVTTDGTSGWSGHLSENTYDAQFYAWCPNVVSQTGTNANFLSDGTNNHLGYKNPQMDVILHSLEQSLTPAQITAKYVAAEKLLVQDAVTLSIFQHPAATAYNITLKNVKPASLTPNLVWNFWQWHY